MTRRSFAVAVGVNVLCVATCGAAMIAALLVGHWGDAVLRSFLMIVPTVALWFLCVAREQFAIRQQIAQTVLDRMRAGVGVDVAVSVDEVHH